MKIVDARGRSCPEPVILTRNAMAEGEKEITVLVSSRNAADNITRFVTHAGAAIKINPKGDEFELLINREK